MAEIKVTIPITDEADAGSCTQAYKVRYHRTGFDVWTQVLPNPIASPIVIEHVQTDTEYEVEIIRVCCNTEESIPVLTTFNIPS
jgi:hypothetical protein